MPDWEEALLTMGAVDEEVGEVDPEKLLEEEEEAPDFDGDADEDQ